MRRREGRQRHGAAGFCGGHGQHHGAGRRWEGPGGVGRIDGEPGAGLPVGAFGGKREIVECIAPLGGVYQAGTLSGNPLAMRAGIRMFEHLRQPNFYVDLNAKMTKLLNGLQQAADAAGVPFRTEHAGGLFGMYFTDQPEITSFEHILKCNADAFRLFFHGMLKRGVNFAPAAYEAGFISIAHSDEDIDFTIQAATEVFAEMKAAEV